MKYLVKLKDRKTGREALVECPANMLLDELSIKIKVELALPYVGGYAFLSNGKAYSLDARDPLFYGNDSEEYSFQYRRFRDSQKFRLRHLFTVTGSSFTYLQDGWHKVCCTLMPA